MSSTLSSGKTGSRHALVFMGAIVVLSALAAPCAWAAIPPGMSVWKFESCVGRQQQAQRPCLRDDAELVILRIRNEVCGSLSQAFHSRAPGAWFHGEATGEQAQVRFVDTFQSSELDVGRAVLRSGKGRLSWRVVRTPRGGRVIDTPVLRRDRKAERSLGAAPTSCTAMEKSHSPVSMRLPP